APGATVAGKAGAGKAFVLRPVGGALQFDAAALTAPAPQQEANANFGAAVTGQGGEIAVGMPGSTVSGKANAGAVVTFREPTQGQPFSLPQLVLATNPALADKFGASVALDDGTLVVGAPGHDEPSAADAGAALVF